MQYGRATYGLAAETRNMAVQHNHELVVPNGHDRRIYGPFIWSTHTVLPHIRMPSAQLYKHHIFSVLGLLPAPQPISGRIYS